MNEPAYEQKRNETAAFVAIKKRLHSLGVNASDMRISDGLCSYGLDYGLSDDELKGLNRRFLQYLTERPEEAIRRYITESVTLTDPFDEHAAIRRVRKLLQARGTDRGAVEVRYAAERIMACQKLATRAEAYAAFEAMLAPVNVAAGWSRLAFASYIEKELTR